MEISDLSGGPFKDSIALVSRGMEGSLVLRNADGL